ncbi:TrkH family potassium uptake protein [Stackebrandtia soli]|uniref:TrkH family potassium uptake protein n=1 Tax=Stackebrandtia soli TaxID=1892856 RepID=UPI0039EC71B6
MRLSSLEIRDRFARHPIRLLPIAFAFTITIGTILLMLPISRRGNGSATIVDALFTATSAVCVTGLASVDTAGHWTAFGQVVILVLIQIGGLGIMTSAALLGLIVSRRIGLQSKMVAQAEIKTLALGDVRAILVRASIIVVCVEAVVAAILTVRFAATYGYDTAEAIWFGVFHSVSSFNSAGFALFTDGFIGFSSDVVICVPIMAAAIIGGLGVPVLFEFTRRRHGWTQWSPHTKLTVTGSGTLLLLGFVIILVFEWSNPATLGPMGVADKLTPAMFQAIMPRSAGLNSLDIGAMLPQTELVIIILMFIGAGSASTGGGIKVTTFFLLGAVIWAEVRGERDVVVFRRRVPTTVVRQAISVALLAVGLVSGGTILVLIISELPFDDVLFEVVSAVGTVGLSTGITTELPGIAKVVLCVLMFLGRVGPVVAASALALRHRHRLYRYPTGQPIVG